jgi:hypothetical protein
VKGNGTRYGDRNWKSPNFPAQYSPDQATPALHDESPSNTSQRQSQDWWQTTELGTVLVDTTDRSTNATDTADAFVDDDEDTISDYIDLVLFAIVQNMKRHQEFSLTQNPGLLQQMAEHSEYITNAENCLNIHIRRIIRNFKTQVGYDACMQACICQTDETHGTDNNIKNNNATAIGNEHNDRDNEMKLKFETQRNDADKEMKLKL